MRTDTKVEKAKKHLLPDLSQLPNLTSLTRIGV